MTSSFPGVAVVCNDTGSRDQAAQVARRLECPLLMGVEPKDVHDLDFTLVCDAQGLSVQQTGAKAPGPVRAEFASGSVDHRRKFGGGKGQMIAKAVGIKAGIYPHIVDLTAGLGRDAFVLASLGSRLTMVERSPLVHLLLEDGLRRGCMAAHDPELRAILSRMELVHMDGADYVQQLTEAPDVIYLDPMFPERQKSAEVKKEMRAFHQLVGKDEDADTLLVAALDKARYRVVVKRSRKAPFLAGREPSYQLAGKTSRFDVYALCKFPESLGSTEPSADS
ncbi:class I SAM-dependent methyltransferase [Marinimicrobium sp. ABcell2]|uniref:class I SAM-dependent methyltransferase n=1 Tax=Marinimicrobium sp. ABcell2 TaxID=3069751 RepID=UPI0027B2DE43|nr:class I SAM-dependent methyltransferase [Marinimicrobium sp. ABcell2]MDQ2078303.1 class I SAM-dependent methyltransferase [Marinimicrobium sp. ABcell2]